MIELQKQFQPKERNICSACGKDVGVSKLVVAGDVNICFECVDLAKEIADKERERLSKKEIERIAAVISAGEKGLIDLGMATAYMYAERLYKAGYRKVE
ncbi:ClpX C4-type zinc finger protein [Providencia rettgeri]